MRLFLSADCEGYWANNVTPYMHILVYHIPHFIREYGNIKEFSCQGVEQNNNTSKVAFFENLTSGMVVPIFYQVNTN